MDCREKASNHAVRLDNTCRVKVLVTEVGRQCTATDAAVQQCSSQKMHPLFSPPPFLLPNLNFQRKGFKQQFAVQQQFALQQLTELFCSQKLHTFILKFFLLFAAGAICIMDSSFHIIPYLVLDNFEVMQLEYFCTFAKYGSLNLFL